MLVISHDLIWISFIDHRQPCETFHDVAKTKPSTASALNLKPSFE